MSATSNPFGFKPVYHASGLDRATPFTGTISTTNALYQYAPCRINGTSGNLEAGDTSSNIYGVVDGFEFTDAQGRRTVSKWFGSALGTVTDSVAWVWTDPNTIYEVQGDGSLNASSVGQQGDTVNPTSGVTIGNGGLGQSTAGLDASSVSNTAAQWTVVGLGREEDNAWGDSYTIVQVKLSQGQVTAHIDGK
jgi:hypothetical protein